MDFLSAIAVILTAGAVVFALTFIYDRLVLPVRPGKGERIFVRLVASGEVPELEGTVKGLMYLNSSGRLPMSLEVVDDGMSPEALATARILARRYGEITLSEGDDGQRAGDAFGQR